MNYDLPLGCYHIIYGLPAETVNQGFDLGTQVTSEEIPKFEICSESKLRPKVKLGPYMKGESLVFQKHGQEIGGDQIFSNPDQTAAPKFKKT